MVHTARMERVTTQQSLDGQQTAATDAVPGNRLARVHGAGRVEAAMAAQKGTDIPPIRPDQLPQRAARDLGHPLRAEPDCLAPYHQWARVARAENSQSASGAQTGSACTTRTTMSIPGRSPLSRKDSRMTRLARLRPTACLIMRLATTIPRRATPRALGRATRRSGPRVKRTLGCRKTASKSRRFRSRWWPRRRRSRSAEPPGEVMRHSREQVHGQNFQRGVSTVKAWLATS